MKPITWLALFLVIAWVLSGCVSAGSTIVPVQTEIPTSSPTPILPTLTSTYTPTATVTVTPTLPATLEPERAKELVSTLLQEPVDCKAPCFWGIEPGLTTLNEAINTFTHLGLKLKFTATLDGKDFYATIYNLDNDIRVSPVIGIQNNTVKSLDVGIEINDTSQMGTPRKWSAYSPETLISQYGPPSRVDFFLGRVAPTPTHSMVLYFEKVNLIVGYIGTNLLHDGPGLEICPLTNQVEFLKIWMGNEPQYPPSLGVPLEKATSLTMDEFSKLMTGDPKKACFKLKGEMFP
jgi:hypothetical protein